MAIARSAPYQRQLIRKFQKIPNNKLTAKSKDRIEDIVGIVQGVRAMQAIVASKGLDIPVKPNGFPTSSTTSTRGSLPSSSS